MTTVASIDRLSIRAAPPTRPVMRQSWGSLLFMHWPIEASLLLPLIPRGLEIDEHDGVAWIGVVPFTMWGIRKTGFPAIPGLNAFHELNVRTYVHCRGVPGVWFFSLEATKRIPIHVARRLYGLPYYLARIALERQSDTIHYQSRRIHPGAPPANFDAAWTIGDALPESKPGTLPFFLTERYCLYAETRRGLSIARIWHQPWPLRKATLSHCESSMVSALGLPEPEGSPLLHYAESIHVNIWGLHRVDAPDAMTL